jgi:long-subunit fatty acid transport protein
VVDAFRDTGVPDKDRYMVGIGFGYQFTPMMGIDVGYAHYLAAGHATMNDSVNRIEPITGAIFLNGRYNNHLDYFGISLRASL